MKQLLYTLLALFAALQQAMAQEDNTHVTVNVDGSPLESLLTEEQKAQVTHLIITGKLAEGDYAVLRELLANQLEELNLRDADIDTLPAHAFDCTLEYRREERTVVLPESLVHLSDCALNVIGSKCAFLISGIYPSFGKYPYGGGNDEYNLHDTRVPILKLAEGNTRYKYENNAIYSLDGDTLYTPNDGNGIYLASGGKLGHGRHKGHTCQCIRTYDLAMGRCDSCQCGHHRRPGFCRSDNCYTTWQGLAFLAYMRSC